MRNLNIMDKLDADKCKDEQKLDLVPVLKELLALNKNHYELMDLVLQQALIAAKETKS